MTTLKIEQITVEEENALISATVRAVDWDKAEPYTTGWTPDHLGRVIQDRRPHKTLCGIRMRGTVRVLPAIRNGLCARCIRSARKAQRYDR